MTNLRKSHEKINGAIAELQSRSLKDLTTFKIGGPARWYAEPNSPQELAQLHQEAVAQDVPVFILGGGSNILVSDHGYDGLVLSTAALNSVTVNGHRLRAQAGAVMDQVCDRAADHGLEGLSFIAGMPGTVGGAVWMNARCYGSEIAEVLVRSYVYDSIHRSFHWVATDPQHWAYKLSPFQDPRYIIVETEFELVPAEKSSIEATMASNRQDRQQKGHFAFPCAGSFFKNNRDFGAPSGQIIDQLGLKGHKIGDAQVAPFHGNILINTGHARAVDMRKLAQEIQKKVHQERGFLLEPEVLMIGSW